MRRCRPGRAGWRARDLRDQAQVKSNAAVGVSYSLTISPSPATSRHPDLPPVILNEVKDLFVGRFFADAQNDEG
ncbi:hypothetical protein NITHO_7160001 [Nitrolancea hollandica Lb]|uniref:Uncharacterized protein n=1 Tax=Nitrolancea hollandica Lb TaxID=1129897 RepID=I4EN22_9BACT|nr:hypothetical protein NITHO_7160001 [Nitrolancea hollandica Lb]